MSTQYFVISEDGQEQGPFDLIGIVKKIRNRNITGETQIKLAGADISKAASEYPDLGEFFSEMEAGDKEEGSGVARQHRFSKCLKNGWLFLQNNQLSTIFSGVFVLTLILLLGIINIVLPKVFVIIGYIGTFIFMQYMFMGYAYSMLRMTRGQPVDFGFIIGKMKPLRQSLLMASLMMSFFIIVGLLLITQGEMLVISIIGLLVLTLPGFYMFAIHIFTPLLILDKGMDFWEAMEASRKAVKSGGWENIGVFYGLITVNFLASMGLIIPLIVTLPITMSPVTEIYDEYFV